MASTSTMARQTSAGQSFASGASTSATFLSIGSWMPLAERSREHCCIAPRDRHPLRPGLAGDVGGHGERQLGGGDWPGCEVGE